MNAPGARECRGKSIEFARNAEQQAQIASHGKNVEMLQASGTLAAAYAQLAVFWQHEGDRADSEGRP